MNDVGHSVLEPAGHAATLIENFWWLMFSICSVVFIIVMLLLAIGLLKRRGSGQPMPPLGDTGFIVAGGIVLPIIVLLFFLVRTLQDTAALALPEASITVQIEGHMWWWDVRYPAEGITTANELYVPVGETIRIELTSADVIHSFWVPSLSGKTDAIPGQITEHWLKVEKPGIFRGQCAEFCGLQHAKMGFYVVGLPREEYQRWVDARRSSKDFTSPVLAVGLNVFTKAGCAECHAIKGTNAEGKIGPDLTHIGSRLSIGAAALPNNHGYLSGWISNPQSLKPGNKMPAAYISAEELDTITKFLRSLR